MRAKGKTEMTAGGRERKPNLYRNYVEKLGHSQGTTQDLVTEFTKGLGKAIVFVAGHNK
jgi:hypothetical protein